jgi:CheY-like chemotaxis protein
MILFVDDEKRRMDNYVEALEESGERVILKVDVDEALKFFDENLDQIELLVLDIMMSYGVSFEDVDTESGLRTGVRFYERIRETAPNLPVIIFTNVTNPDLKKRFDKEKRCWFYRKERKLPPEFRDVVKSILAGSEDEEKQYGN